MITLGLVARDESKYLQEWVVYHHLIGVKKFIIYLHNCTDDSESKLKKLELDLDIRKKETNELGWEVKNEMYKSIILDSVTPYACCLDIDEFLFLPQHEDINVFISKFKNIGGIALYQHIFGPNGHVESPSGLVIDNYVKRTPDDVDFPKNFPKYDQPFDMLKNVKMIIEKSSLKKVNSSHDYVSSKPIIDEKGGVFSKYKCERSLSKIRINHYYTKSLEDWIFKTSRTRFSMSFKYPNSWFNYYNEFDFVDESLKNKYSSKIKDFLSDII
jgi:hypothetical protein